MWAYEHPMQVYGWLDDDCVEQEPPLDEPYNPDYSPDYEGNKESEESSEPHWITEKEAENEIRPF
jgi:hypothetical protein